MCVWRRDVAVRPDDSPRAMNGGATPSPFLLPRPDLREVHEQLMASRPDLRPALLPRNGPIQSMRAGSIAIVNTANRPWTILHTETLLTTFPDCHFQEFYFSTGARPFQNRGSVCDARMSCCATLPDLVKGLQEFRPGALYLRVSPHTRSEHLIAILRLVLPQVILIVEAYDLSCLFERRSLDHVTGGDTSALENALLGCAVALHHADALVVKMGGARFADYKRAVTTRFIAHYPVHAESSPLPTPPLHDREARRILYAGSACARELNEGMGAVHGANLLRYFDALRDDSRFTLDIVNAAHDLPEEDQHPKFAALIERYGSLPGRPPPRNLRYHRSMSLTALLNFARDFDLGICCAHYADDRVEDVTRVSLPNRMTTYLSAGLPVAIDDRFEFAAELLTDFGAGLVVPAGDFQHLRETLANGDLSSLRRGGEALVAHLEAENRRHLQTLAEVFQATPSASTQGQAASLARTQE